MTASKLNPDDYPPTLADVLRQLPLAPLGPGTPDRAMGGRLLVLDALGTADEDMASACQAGLWLAFDFLFESHAISQELHTPEGSFWHAIMHSREPDASNSKYWWRRV